MNILFVCKYNRFRSKVAEAFFNKYNKNKELKAKSAGVIDPFHHFVSKIAADVLAEQKVKLPNEQPTLISDQAIKWADKIVIVAYNVEPKIFQGKDVEVWKIEDAHDEDISAIKKTIKEIEERIKEFVRLLDNSSNRKKNEYS